MHKKGEARKLFVHILFVIIMILGIYFIITSTSNLTGYAVLDASTAKSKLESALTSSVLFSNVADGSICVVINDPEKPLSLEAIKSSAGWTVAEMKGFCTGLSNEDIVIQFQSYDTYSKIVDNPSPKNIALGAENRDFEILESKYVELGGNVICDATFKAKFCDASKLMGTPEQLIDADLTCCIDELTSAQRKELEAHLQQGNYKDELATLESPSSMFAGLSTTTSLLALGGIITVLIVIIVMVFTRGGKTPAQKGPAGMPKAASPAMPQMQPMQSAFGEAPEITELRNYVIQAIGEGYEPSDIRTHLLEIGWNTQTADKVISEAAQRTGVAQ